MNRIVTIAAMLLAWTGAWAGDVTINITPSNAGTVEASQAAAGETCTLTVTPAQGYYLTAENLTASTVISGGVVQARHRAIGIDNEQLTITAVNTEADPSGVTTYTFTMPTDANIDVEVTAEFQTLIAIKPTVTLEGWTYGATANTPVVEGNLGGGEVTFTYATQGGTSYSATVPSDAGDYTVKAVVAAAKQYAAGQATADFTISKAAAAVTTAPAAVANLSYTGEAQALITAGTATGGTLQYKLGANGTYGTDVPTATAADTYTVYYKVVADANHTDVAEASIEVTIGKAAAAVVNAPAAVANLSYTGEAQALITAGEAVGGELQYKLGENGTYSTAVPTATAAGNYEVYYKVVADANHNDVAETSIAVTIGKAAATVTKAPAAVANLAYTGEAQALITAGEATGGELQYKLGENGIYSTAVPTATAAGNYEVYYKVVADANHNDVAETSIAVTIGKAAAAVTTAPAAVANLSYTGKAQTLITAGTATGGTLQYKLGANGTYGTDVPTATAADTYTVYYKVVADANHTDVAEASIEVTIGKAAAAVTTAPAAIANLSYTGEAQALITAGTATGGTLQYKLGANGTYGTDVPTATAADTYTVYYKVVADANHTDVAEASIEVTIGKAAAAVVNAPAAVANLSYTGEAQALITAGTATGGTLQYKLGANGTYGTDVPTATAADTYTVYYKVVADANHTDVAEASIEVTIGKAAAAVTTAPAAIANLSYTGEAQALITAGTATGGTLQYKLGANGTYGTDVPTATAADTYTVYYKVVADANHTDVAEASIEVTIGKAAAAVTTAPAAVANLAYTGAVQTLVTEGEATGGTLQYKLGAEGTYSTTLPTATAAGSYTVFYKVFADANHNDSEESSVVVTIGKTMAAVTTAPAAKTLTYTGAAQALVNEGVATGGTLQYKLGADGTYTTAVPTATDAATYTVYYKVVADANHDDAEEGSVMVTIGKAAAVVTLAPAAIDNLAYTGQPQALITAGEAEGGTLYYKLGEDGTYSTDVPTATAAESYVVYYKVVGDANHTDFAETSFVVAFGKSAVIIATAPAGVANLNYTGEPQTLVTAGEVEGGTLVYALAADGEFTTTLPTGTDAGDYTVYYKVNGDANHNDVATASINVTIDKAGIKPVVELADWTFGAEASDPVITGNLGQGAVTITYKAANAESFAADVPTDAGSYTVKVTIAETDNYAAGEATADFTIGKANISALDSPAAVADLVYTGSPQTLVVAGGANGGTLVYALAADGEYTTTLPTGIDAGDYTVYYKVNGDANHNDVAVASLNVTIGKAAIKPVVELADWTYGAEANEPVVTGNLGQGAVTITYKAANAETFAVDVPTAAGSYVVKAAIAATDNYAAGEATADFTIGKAAATVTTIPTAITDLVYTGEPQTLATAGEAEGGTMVYALAADGEYTTTLPTGTDAGDYTVYYKVNGDANHSDVAAASLNVTIGKAGIKPVVELAGWTYGAEANEPVVTGNLGQGAVTITYKAANAETFAADVPTAAGSYVVKAAIAATDNYVAGEATADFTIGKATITELELAEETLVYNGEFQSVVIERVLAGDLQLTANDFTVSGNSQKEVGEYTVTVTAAAGSNYQGEATATFTIVNKTLAIEDLFADGNTYATYYNIEEDMLLPDGVVAYVVTGVEGAAVTTQALSYIPQSTAVLLEKTNDAVVRNDVFTTNLLTGAATAVDVETISDGTVYVLFNDEFVKSVSGSVPEGRAYLVLYGAVPYGARLSILSGDTMGINLVKADSKHDTWYTLDGVKLQNKPSAKGLYIKNGRKVVIK